MREKNEKPPITNRGVTGQNDGFDPTASRPAISVPIAIASGIDWLTATTDKEETGFAWYDLFCRSAGKTSEWRNKWYTGRKGEGYRWGYSPRQGYIFISTGKTTPQIFKAIVPAAKNVTRVDFQVTVEMPDALPCLVEDYYAQVCECNKRKYTLIQNNKGGKTLYVGSRQSAQFGRVYDKGVESKGAKPGKLWRYEVELKQHRGDAIARRLLAYIPQSDEQGMSEMNRTIQRAIVPAVWEWFDDRGIHPIFDRIGDNELVVEIGRSVTSDDRKLEWLTTQVRPTIQDFVSRGLVHKLEKAIGINIDRPF